MSLPTFTANTAALAEDVTSIVTHLQGASGNTEAWHFRCSTSNNFLITLSDAAGARKFSIRDSALSEVFSVDSDGNVTLSGSITTGTFTFPVSVTPTPTTEAQALWDTDDNLLAVGDGAATKIMIPTPTTTAGDIEYASGARAHSRLAIGTAGQVLTVNAGATAPSWGGGATFKWTAATQTVSASTTFVDMVAVGSPATMTFTPENGGIYRCEYDIPLTFTGTGGAKFQFTGGTITAASIRAYIPIYNNTATGPYAAWGAATTALSTTFAAASAAVSTDSLYTTSLNGGNIHITMYYASTSTTAVTLQYAQNTANGTTVIGIGATMKVEKMN